MYYLGQECTVLHEINKEQALIEIETGLHDEHEGWMDGNPVHAIVETRYLSKEKEFNKEIRTKRKLEIERLELKFTEGKRKIHERETERRQALKEREEELRTAMNELIKQLKNDGWSTSWFDKNVLYKHYHDNFTDMVVVHAKEGEDGISVEVHGLNGHATVGTCKTYKQIANLYNALTEDCDE